MKIEAATLAIAYMLNHYFNVGRHIYELVANFSYVELDAEYKAWSNVYAGELGAQEGK